MAKPRYQWRLESQALAPAEQGGRDPSVEGASVLGSRCIWCAAVEQALGSVVARRREQARWHGVTGSVGVRVNRSVGRKKRPTMDERLPKENGGGRSHHCASSRWIMATADVRHTIGGITRSRRCLRAIRRHRRRARSNPSTSVLGKGRDADEVVRRVRVLCS